VSQSALAFPQPLWKKYQPATIEDFVGLEKPRKVLQRFAANPYPAAWIFSGESGLGKTTMALALCSAVAGELHHIPSQECTVENVKRVTDQCHYYPRMVQDGTPGRFHFVLVDEAHKMSAAAHLAFLSKLDSTAFPPNTIFVFTCNSVAEFGDTFMSRCLHLPFSSKGMAPEISRLLANVWRQETDSEEVPDFDRIAKDAGNNARQALADLEVRLMMV